MRNRASANPTIEAIEDVNVQVHTYDAETGRTGGGTFNVATKSGTNDWHGSGFYQKRPKWGTANNYFSELRRRTDARDLFPPGRRRLRRPDHAGTARSSGSAAEGYGSNTTRNGNLRFPTSRERRGDFSQTRRRGRAARASSTTR